MKSSSELNLKTKEKVCSQKFKNPKPLKERFTWQEKQNWPQTNKVSNSVALNARISQGGVQHKKKLLKTMSLD